jgi:hypothetical protein
MQIAIAVGTLLLGAWTLNQPPEEDQTTEEQPGVTAAEPGPSPMLPQRKVKKGPGEEGAIPGAEDQQRMRRSMQNQERRRQAMVMPIAPTDAAGTAMRGQPSVPTTSEVGPGMYGTRTPQAPTSQRRAQAQYRPMSHGPQTPNQAAGATQASAGMAFSTQQNAAQQAAPPAAEAAARNEKLFANFRAQSGISPYMNLFRTGTALGTIDNYTSLVRPELEQRYLNQQVNKDIVGLERNSRLQQMRLQMLNQEQGRSLQGVGTPQYYMNYGSFYQNGQ